MRILTALDAVVAVMGCALRGPAIHGPAAAVSVVEGSAFVRDLKSRHPTTAVVVWADGHLGDGELVSVGEVVRDGADSGHSVRWATVLVSPDGTLCRYDVVNGCRGEVIR